MTKLMFLGLLFLRMCGQRLKMYTNFCNLFEGRKCLFIYLLFPIFYRCPPLRPCSKPCWSKFGDTDFACPHGQRVRGLGRYGELWDGPRPKSTKTAKKSPFFAQWSSQGNFDHTDGATGGKGGIPTLFLGKVRKVLPPGLASNPWTPPTKGATFTSTKRRGTRASNKFCLFRGGHPGLVEDKNEKMAGRKVLK